MARKALLVNLPPAPDYDAALEAGTVYPSTGILLAGTVLKASGLRVQVVDGSLHADYVSRALAALDGETALLGLSVMTSQVPMALALSQAAKNLRPDLLVVWGGIHPILFPEQTLGSHHVDMVVVGEGIQTAQDLAEHVLGKREKGQIRGVAFRGPEGIAFTPKADADDIASLPHFDYGILDDVEAYLGARSVYQRELAPGGEPIRIMPILSGLGCAYKCQFCINVILKRRYRWRKAEDIVSEVKRLQQAYGANAFIFYDEDFLINKPRLLRFLELIEAEGLRFKWRIWARVSYFREGYVDQDVIRRLERAGLRSCVMGGESGSQQMLDRMEKGTKVEGILRSAQMLRGTQITPRYSFMVGYDQESREDTRKTYRLCADLIEANPKVDIAGPFVFRCYPGSAVFARLAQSHAIPVPSRIEDWAGALTREGFLKVPAMPWTWPGCADAADMLGAELVLADRLRRSGNPVFLPLLWLFRFRLKTFILTLPLEYHAYRGLRALYHWLRKSH